MASNGRYIVVASDKAIQLVNPDTLEILETISASVRGKIDELQAFANNTVSIRSGDDIQVYPLGVAEVPRPVVERAESEVEELDIG